MQSRSFSMAGRASLWLGGGALAGVLVSTALRMLVEIPWLAAALSALLLVPLVGWAGTRLTARWSRMARALNDGVLSLKDRDFSMSVTRATNDELGELVSNYNTLGER